MNSPGERSRLLTVALGGSSAKAPSNRDTNSEVRSAPESRLGRSVKTVVTVETGRSVSVAS